MSELNNILETPAAEVSDTSVDASEIQSDTPDQPVDTAETKILTPEEAAAALAEYDVETAEWDKPEAKEEIETPTNEEPVKEVDDQVKQEEEEIEEIPADAPNSLIRDNMKKLSAEKKLVEAELAEANQKLEANNSSSSEQVVELQKRIDEFEAKEKKRIEQESYVDPMKHPDVMKHDQAITSSFNRLRSKIQRKTPNINDPNLMDELLKDYVSVENKVGTDEYDAFSDKLEDKFDDSTDAVYDWLVDAADDYKQGVTKYHEVKEQGGGMQEAQIKAEVDSSLKEFTKMRDMTLNPDPAILEAEPYSVHSIIHEEYNNDESFKETVGKLVAYTQKGLVKPMPITDSTIPSEERAKMYNTLKAQNVEAKKEILNNSLKGLAAQALIPRMKAEIAKLKKELSMGDISPSKVTSPSSGNKPAPRQVMSWDDVKLEDMG